ncbi:MAG: hypothetical protein ABMA64_29495 [Myxococcota bacterium]
MNGARGWWVVAASLAAGCHGDFLRSNGALGRISYGYGLDYEGGDDLTDLWLETGYEQSFSAELTPEGARWVDGRGAGIVHSAAGARVESDSDDTALAGFSILAQEPGTYRLESTLDRDLVDYIDLRFEDPTHLDLITFLREPWQEEWSRLGVADEVLATEGAQIAFLAIPMADDHRLGAEYEPDVAIDVPELVVPDATVLAVQEGGITGAVNTDLYYLIEPGVVTFTVSDPVHGVAVERAVTVE